MKLQKALIGGLNNRPVREWIIGDQYCLVNSTRWGLAANPQDRPLTKFEGHQKFESKELASLLLNEDTGKACLGMAAVNSDMKIDSRLFRQGNLVDLILSGSEAKTLAFIGHFHFLNDRKAIPEKTMVFELDPQPGDLPYDSLPKYLPRADVVAMTGMTIVNHTFSEVMKHIRKDAKVFMLGASAPLNPILFDFGIDAIGGIMVEDPEGAKALARGETGIRKAYGLKKVIMTKG